MKNDAIIRKSLAEEVATAIEEKIKMGAFPVDQQFAKLLNTYASLAI